MNHPSVRLDSYQRLARLREREKVMHMTTEKNCSQDIYELSSINHFKNFLRLLRFLSLSHTYSLSLSLSLSVSLPLSLSPLPLRVTFSRSNFFCWKLKRLDEEAALHLKPTRQTKQTQLIPTTTLIEQKVKNSVSTKL